MENQNQLPQSQQPKGTTFLRTCFNGFNALSGLGLLSIPYALSQGGWLSLIILLLVALLCWYTGLLLQRCMDPHPFIKTYPDLGELAFGYKGRVLISIFVYLELYLVAVQFLILEGDNLEKLFPNRKFKISSLKIGGKQGFVVVAALIILPITWLRSIGKLAYVSAGGILAGVIVVCCVFWIGFGDGVGFHERVVLLNWRGLPMASSLFIFCYCGHSVFPTLRNSMQDKSQFSKVLLVCFIASSINYGSMAVIGYLMYGENLKPQVTLNLPTKRISAQIAIYVTLINPISKYPLVITPIANAIEERFVINNSRPLSIIIRTTIVISTVIVALTVPFFASLMAFTGASTSVTVSILLPCMCYLKITRNSQTFGLEKIIVVGILMLGSVGCILGTYVSSKQIVKNR